ncbi:oleoyl-(acyl-carrier-protein) hydrolase [Oleiphilus messinensis]|uniref:Oleoyl-(Acyl-carrier-protein) hydrolase n=1 Tax=Oleiphilus messinensis TaxID=141451 RepID=A0A1Y0ICC6_9GAMM|nr:thioesterase domain-containing protein [Oleiphilus messinensis]ARU57789.1 oleoyl-(acyl-carrier-protein) hydrolase [Oleiphilus messinensis]
MTHSPWLIPPTSELATDRPALICIPFSGGSAQYFHTWRKDLEHAIDLRAVQLPGRAERFQEATIENMESLIPPLAEAIHGTISNDNTGTNHKPRTQPFSLFGHSLGSLIAFELCHYLNEHYGISPEHLFVSGHSAPHCEWPETRRRPRILSSLPEAAFIEQLIRLGGTPQELLRDRELLAFFLPTLRADFGLLESYKFQSREPLDIPVTALGGLSDLNDVPQTQVRAWAELTLADFHCFMLEGDHFFINNQKLKVQEILLTTLTSNHKKRQATGATRFTEQTT